MLPRCLSRVCRYANIPPPLRATHHSRSIDPINLEVFKFGLYIMFPIGWMWYFGTNLENRFTIPDFWPKEGETHKIPFDRDEQRLLAQKLRESRLEKRRRRLELEGIIVPEEAVREVAEASDRVGKTRVQDKEEEHVEQAVESREVERRRMEDRGFGKGAIERWARGE
ncbi:uncharacterized protein KY384_003560 [Bacidia gigantensis]|uniref:uncharacterized protein n=1 Tax=Bacidia gigantensis TaxID=2732470 RepID=UPI001D03C18B|nr:uncharacterized protein KY384_003560 [Bacidia gigantensis]KAG8531924.1 hypothetical protein KY384_003560 [Bacidia gigantensis]